MSLKELNAETLKNKLADDTAAIAIYRDGLSSILTYIDSNPEIFNPDDGVFPTRSQKEDLWNTWQSYLDYHLALESIRQYYSDFSLLENKGYRRKTFRVLYAAFLAQYRYALELLEKTDRHHMADKILNDAVPEIGLPPDTFAEFKYRYLNLLRAGEYSALRVINGTIERPHDDLDSEIREDASIIWNMGKGKGETLTLKNAAQVVRNNTFKIWFPVQAGVSQFMGDVRVKRSGTFLITSGQIGQLIPELRPGDIIITRREWFLSNVGLPGFWSHAALYTGTADERGEYFEADLTKSWLKGRGEEARDFEEMLQSRYPQAYELSLEKDSSGNPKRIIEAVGEGVIFTTAERALGADSIAVLRPKLTRNEKALAILRAFHYSGRPYDFNFDFSTDSALVCSELIYKSYESGAGNTGLKLPLIRVAGRPVTPPNNLARLFDEEFDSSHQQLDFVAFLDGFESKGSALHGTVEEFRKSWKRPNWHILLQKEPQGQPEEQ